MTLFNSTETVQALDKAKEAARLCNRIQHRALSSQHLDHRVTCPDTLVFKVSCNLSLTRVQNNKNFATSYGRFFVCNMLQLHALNFILFSRKVTHQYGVTLALAGKFRQAEKIFLNLLRQSSDHEGYQPTVNASLATLYQENGDFSRALQIWLTLFDDNAFPPGAERYRTSTHFQ